MAGQKNHIFLVHGACHGAWSWHKVTTLLRAAGHRVTALDLAASGVDERRFEELRTFADYTRPLIDALDSLPPGERAILVGHSLGGLNIAQAMDRFPEKIAAGVFVAAFMPDSANPPGFIYGKVWTPIPKLFNRSYKFNTLPYDWADTQFGTVGDSPISMLFGPEFLAKLYRLSPPEDLTLSTTLMRPASLFVQELVASPPLSQYGSVEKFYIVCAKDEGIPESFQRWMIENNQVREVRELEDADHMPMLSVPQQLCQYILEIAGNCD